MSNYLKGDEDVIHIGMWLEVQGYFQERKTLKAIWLFWSILAIAAQVFSIYSFYSETGTFIIEFLKIKNPDKYVTKVTKCDLGFGYYAMMSIGVVMFCNEIYSKLVLS